MAILSEILSLLGQWGPWKRITEAPDRLDKIEERLAALEAKAPKQAGKPCPACGEPALRRVSSVKDPGPFGDLGARIETWKCEACGDTEEKMVSA